VFAKVKPNTQIIGQNIIYFNSIESTNSFALELLKQNLAGDGSVILAEYQSRGKGQGSNQWLSQPYLNLLFSLILQPVTLEAVNPFTFNKAITIAVCQTIQKILPHEEVKIKWPNDILINSLKVAGILTENNFSGSQLKSCVAGIGINVNQDDVDLKSMDAASLKSFKGDEIERNQLLQEILECIEFYYFEMLHGEKDNINTIFDQLLFGFGKKNHFNMNGNRIEAYLCGCDREGRLILESQEYGTQKYMHGHIKQIIHE
jgi:BirA family biotin operon repressor/biotin-[acetyl-CoA-carboxylase] ligase